MSAYVMWLAQVGPDQVGPILGVSDFQGLQL